MLRARLIPVLLLKNGRLVKPKRFGGGGERDVGPPVTTAGIYDSQDADELLFLDISATGEGRKFLLDTLEKVVKNCFVPLTAGGGIKTIGDVQEVLNKGADKVAVNPAGVERPELITKIADKFGSQCVVVSVDAKKIGDGYKVYTRGGKHATDYSVIDWVKEACARGAGEILLTSIDKEGMMNGYDLDLTREAAESVSIPIIANGGSGSRQDFVDAINKGHASAVAASSVFHFSDSNLTQVIGFMFNAGVKVRPI